MKESSLSEGVKQALDQTLGTLSATGHVVKSKSASDASWVQRKLSIMLNLLKMEVLILTVISVCAVLSLMLPMVAVLAIVKPKASVKSERQVPVVRRPQVNARLEGADWPVDIDLDEEDRNEG